jgi:hypothetical protein
MSQTKSSPFKPNSHESISKIKKIAKALRIWFTSEHKIEKLFWATTVL